MDDIVEITDWSTRSAAEILDVIEYHTDVLRGATLYDLAWIMEPAKALVARAAELAAEVERLKAEVAARQGWRPVTNTNPPPMEHVIISSSDGFDVGWRLQEVPHLWLTRRGRSYLTEEIHGWSALPAPSQE